MAVHISGQVFYLQEAQVWAVHLPALHCWIVYKLCKNSARAVAKTKIKIKFVRIPAQELFLLYRSQKPLFQRAESVNFTMKNWRFPLASSISVHRKEFSLSSRPLPITFLLTRMLLGNRMMLLLYDKLSKINCWNTVNPEVTGIIQNIWHIAYKNTSTVGSSILTLHILITINTLHHILIVNQQFDTGIKELLLYLENWVMHTVTINNEFHACI